MTSLKVSEPLSQVVEEVLIIAEIQDVTLRPSASIQFIWLLFDKGFKGPAP